MDVEALERAKACTESVRGETVPKGRHLSRIELQALVTACERDSSPAGVRDALIIALLAAGLRRNEVAEAQLQDLELKASALVVRGKGNKERIIFVVGGGRVALDAWLQLRGNEPGSLFFAINKSGVVQAGSGLSSQSVYKALLKRAEEAKVEVKPHDLRRTLIGEAFTAGVDVATIQRIVGHSSPATTSRYDRRNDEVKRAALGLLSIDFKHAWSAETPHAR